MHSSTYSIKVVTEYINYNNKYSVEYSTQAGSENDVLNTDFPKIFSAAVMSSVVRAKAES